MKILCQDRKTLIPEAEGTGKRFTNRINCLRTALHKLLGLIFGTRIPFRDKHVAPLFFCIKIRSLPDLTISYSKIIDIFRQCINYI